MGKLRYTNNCVIIETFCRCVLFVHTFKYLGMYFAQLLQCACGWTLSCGVFQFNYFVWSSQCVLGLHWFQFPDNSQTICCRVMGHARNMLDAILIAELSKLFANESSGVVTDENMSAAMSAEWLSQVTDGRGWGQPLSTSNGHRPTPVSFYPWMYLRNRCTVATNG